MRIQIQLVMSWMESTLTGCQRSWLEEVWKERGNEFRNKDLVPQPKGRVTRKSGWLDIC